MLKYTCPGCFKKLYVAVFIWSTKFCKIDNIYIGMIREYFELAWISFYLPMATFCDGTKVSNVGHQNGQTAAMGSDVGLYALDLVDVHIDPLGSVAGHRTWDS